MNVYGNFSGSWLHGGPLFPQFGLCLVTRRWRSKVQIIPGWLTPSPFHSQQVSWLFACWTALGCLHNANIPSTLPILLLNQVRKPGSSVPLKNSVFREGRKSTRLPLPRLGEFSYSLPVWFYNQEYGCQEGERVSSGDRRLSCRKQYFFFYRCLPLLLS